MVLSAIERRLEKLVEGVFNSTLKSGLQPVELGRRLTKAMDSERSVGVRGSLVAPNEFLFELSQADFDRFEQLLGSLQRDLALSAKDHAANEGYNFVGPVVITISAGAAIKPGQFMLAARSNANVDANLIKAHVVGPNSRKYALDELSRFVIGRAPECSLSLADANASRKHAEIRYEGNGYVIEDLNSTNGTKVNGLDIRQHQLVDGDQISIGNSQLQFEIG